MKKFLNFVFSKTFGKNIAFILGLLILCFVILKISLRIYTKHGESVTMPNVVGLQFDEAKKIIEDNDFTYEILDTVYDNSVPKGAVSEQNPAAESHVKKGRTIYIKINSQEDELIKMPSFTGYTMRQVAAMANQNGLEIGNLRYVPDIAVNVVIKQLYNGVEIAEGAPIKKGATIDLIVGLGLDDRTTGIPWLVGKTYKEASAQLLDLFLNIGAISYDSNVKTKKDSLNAKIYKQSPSGAIKEVNLGYNVDIWLTLDQTLIDEKLTEIAKDSLSREYSSEEEVSFED